MILAGAVVPLLAAAVLAAGAHPVARRLPPRTTVRLLTGAALVIAAASGFVLAVLAFTVAGSDTEVAALGHWSAPAVARLAAIPTPVGVAAGGALLLLAVSTVRRLGHATRALWAANAACGRLSDHVDGLVVVDDEQADAYALPGLPGLPGLRGRIVVSSGMLDALTTAERRVLFAHERSHLEHRHALFVQLADVAAAANPLLRPVGHAVRDSVERWADEDAALAVADRRLAARALARAALAAARRPDRGKDGAAALAVTATPVAVRAQALLAPAPRPRRALAAAVLGCALAAGVGALLVEHSAEHAFERAGSITQPR